MGVYKQLVHLYVCEREKSYACCIFVEVRLISVCVVVKTDTSFPVMLLIFRGNVYFPNRSPTAPASAVSFVLERFASGVLT